MTSDRSTPPPLTRLRGALVGRERRTGAPAHHPARAAAVLVLVVPGAADWALVLTRRRSDLPSHAGQISFPGGKRSDADPDAAACALREAREELGIDPAVVEVVGLLDDVITPTGFLITPVVGWCREAPRYRPSPSEVAEVFEVSLAHLRDPAAHRDGGALTLEGIDYRLHEYEHQGRIIWGATARVVHQLLELWPCESAGATRERA